MNALALPVFRNYLAVNTLSFLGNWVERLSLSWLAWQTSHSAVWTGLISVGHIIPSAFLGPICGALTEGWELRRAATVINAVLAALSTSLFAVVILFHPPVPALALIAIMIGVVTALFQPVRLVMISRLVPADTLSSAARLSATAFNLSRVLGPALAGFLIATVGTDWSLAVNPGTYLPLIYVLQTMKLLPRPRPEGKQEPLWASIREGMAYLGRDRTIGWCMVLTACNALLARSMLETMPVIVGKLLHGDSTLLATVTAVSGGGAILASFIASAIVPSHYNAGRIAGIAALAAGLGAALLGSAPEGTLMLVAIAATSLFTTLSSINSQALVYGVAQPAYRARTLTWWSTFSLGSAAGGGVLLSIAAQSVPLGAVLVGGGVVAACMAGILLAVHPAAPPPANARA